MGYSARYHVASLAAVFLALGVGILIGTGLGKNVVNDTTRNLESSLKGDLLSARGQVSSLRADLRRQQTFASTVYPALTHGALPGGRIAVISLGGLDGAVRSDIERILGAQNETGAHVKEFAVLREPPDIAALNGELRGTRFHPLRNNPADLAAFGRHAARAVVKGGPLFKRTSGALLARRSGRPGRISGVIVTRSAPQNLGKTASAATNGLESGVLDGLERTGLPVVAVESTGTDPSSIPLFRSHGLTTVDDVDLTAGSVALVYALRGARGNFGVGSNATQLLPPLTRLRRATRNLSTPTATTPASHHP
jgi:copper transport outer membrane protein MctB